MAQYVEVGSEVIEFPDNMTPEQIAAVLRKQFPAPADADPELSRHRNRAAVAETQRTPVAGKDVRAAKVAAIDKRTEAISSELADLAELEAPELGNFHPRASALREERRKLQEERNRLTPGDAGRMTGGAVGGLVGGAAGALTGPAAPIAIPALSAVGGFIGSSIGGHIDRSKVVDLTQEEADELANQQMIEDAVIEGAFALIPIVGGKVGRVALNTPAGKRLAAALKRLNEPALTDAVRKIPVTPQDSARVAKEAADAAKAARDAETLGAEMSPALARRVDEALRANPGADPAAVRRALEFEELGITPTQGQVTRDPTQYARERNLRGVQNGGEPLANRFAEQNQQLTQQLDDLSRGAKPSDEAGAEIIGSLRTMDDTKRAGIDDAYRAARDSEGRAAAIDADGFVQRVESELHDSMLRYQLPVEARAILDDVVNGSLPLTVETVEIMQTRLAEMQRASSGKPAAQKAIGVIRDALADAEIDGAAGVEARAAFDKARGMARERFQQIDAIPGLKAALDGETPDHFVRRFVIGGDTGSVDRLMRTLQADPAAAQQARAQVAAHLREKALGANAAGDAGFGQSNFNRALNELGPNKLRAIFGAETAEKLEIMGRVAAYIQAHPAGSAVNNSNTAAAMANIVGDITASGGLGSFIGLRVLRDQWRSMVNERFAADAVKVNVSKEAAERETRKLLAFVTGATNAARASTRAWQGDEEMAE